MSCVMICLAARRMKKPAGGRSERSNPQQGPPSLPTYDCPERSKKVVQALVRWRRAGACAQARARNASTASLSVPLLDLPRRDLPERIGDEQRVIDDVAVSEPAGLGQQSE
jgi:hypothetical protein